MMNNTGTTNPQVPNTCSWKISKYSQYLFIRNGLSLDQVALKEIFFEGKN